MTTTQTDPKVQQWTNLAQQLRVDSIRSTTAAGSGHPTSSMSAADLMAVLLTSYLHYDFDNPKNPNNDHLIFSKGHASPLLYSLYKAAGAISDEELMTLRKFGSRLEGHPTPILPWVDVATGSLGQGLPIGVGVALAGKYLDKLPYHIWVLLGDSEMAEGSVWEAFDHASYYKLDNLVGILDVNRLGQRGETMHGWHTEVYEARAKAFGWNAIVIDGHNYDEINRAFAQAAQPNGLPTLIIAKTIKGKGVSFLENKNGWHGKALNKEQEEQALQELNHVRSQTYPVQKPENLQPAPEPAKKALELPKYDGKEEVATRKTYGDALVALGAANPDVVGLDGEVSNSTYADEFAKAYPDRFFEQYIAEQQLVAAAVGMSVRHKIPFASTFAAFFTRAFDFIRMAAISRANIRLVGSHAGITLHEALKAYEQLRSQRITIRVIDAYSVKPIDDETLYAAAQEAGNKIVVVEDHWPEGGLGDAVLEAFSQQDGPMPEVVKLAVSSMPGSGTPAELMEEAGISAHHIVGAVS